MKKKYGEITMFVRNEFDPASASGRKWLDQFAAKIATTGVKCHHVSNNALRDICELDAERRKQGLAVAGVWLQACGRLGAKTMRVNTGGPRIVPPAAATPGGYSKNDEVVKYLKNAIESFKEMADYGARAGVKVTIENHWGLSADPIHVRIMNNAKFKGIFALEYEAGPWDGVEGSRYLMKEVLAAL